MENACYARERIPADLDWHHVHNLDLLATSYEHKGQMRTAEQLLRHGKRDEGAQLLKDVAARLRALPGPDAWTQALFRLEAFARIARDAGDWELAEHMARQMLEHDSAYAGGHHALALVARQRGDAGLAHTEAAAARTYWRDADPALKELADLRAL